MWWLHCMVRVCVLLWETASLSSIVAIPFCISTSKQWEPLLLYIIACTWCCQHFGFWPFNRCAKAFHCYFNMQFPTDTWCWASFHLPSAYFFSKVFVQIFSPSFAFLKLGCSVSYCSVLKVLFIFWKTIL